MTNNLPPGVTDSMIPGNRREDDEWDDLIDEILASPFTAYDARQRWEVGNRVAEHYPHLFAQLSKIGR